MITFAAVQPAPIPYSSVHAASACASGKLEALQVDNPALIVSANVGCQLHLDEESKIPVKHWIELLDPLTHQGH